MVCRVTVTVWVPAGKSTVISSVSKWMWFRGVVMPRVGSSRSAWVTRYLTRLSSMLACRALSVGALRATVNDTGWPSFTHAWSLVTDTAGLTPSSS